MLPSLLLMLVTQNPYLDEGRRQAMQLHFAEAIEQLKVARQVKGPDLPEVLALLGRCQVAEGLRAEATATFTELLTLDPSAELDRKLSPKILEVFDGVKQRLYPPDFVAFENLERSRNKASFTVIDPWRRVAQVAVLSSSSSEERTVPVVDARVFIAMQDADLETEPWWVEARDVSGTVLAHLGSREKPELFTAPSRYVEEPVVVERTPRIQRIPAWVAIAVAIGAGIAGATMQSRSLDRARAARESEWSDTARQLRSSAVTDAAIATGLFIGAGTATATGVVLFAW